MPICAIIAPFHQLTSLFHLYKSKIIQTRQPKGANMLILGISAYYHDSAIAIIRDDSILFALQEERLSRIKGDSSFPRESITAGLNFLATSGDYTGGGAK